MAEKPIIETIDSDVVETLASRRAVIRSGGSLGLKLAAGGVPFALAATAKAAYGAQLPAQVVDVLNFALTLEYLESEFYIAGVDSGIIPASSSIGGQTFRDLALFTTIRDHEIVHVEFLEGALGASAVAKPTFDFTGGDGSGAGPFSPFSDYEQFKLLAQAFEDTGVRAYKGQVATLQPFDSVLTAAATIHSVEARHASEVRRLRGLEGWIPFDQPGAPAAVAPVYDGEELLNLPLGAVAGFGGITEEEVTESFDEPLNMEQVLAIADPFIAG